MYGLTTMGSAETRGSLLGLLPGSASTFHSLICWSRDPVTTCRSVTHAIPNTQSVCPCKPCQPPSPYHTHPTSERPLLHACAFCYEGGRGSQGGTRASCAYLTRARRLQQPCLTVQQGDLQRETRRTTSACTGSSWGAQGDPAVPSSRTARIWQSAGLEPPVASSRRSGLSATACMPQFAAGASAAPAPPAALRCGAAGIATRRYCSTPKIHTLSQLLTPHR